MVVKRDRQNADEKQRAQNDPEEWWAVASRVCERIVRHGLAAGTIVSAQSAMLLDGVGQALLNRYEPKVLGRIRSGFCVNCGFAEAKSGKFISSLFSIV